MQITLESHVAIMGTLLLLIFEKIDIAGHNHLVFSFETKWLQRLILIDNNLIGIYYLINLMIWLIYRNMSETQTFTLNLNKYQHRE